MTQEDITREATALSHGSVLVASAIANVLRRVSGCGNSLADCSACRADQ